MAEYDLVMPFLTDDPAFAHGVEFGLLYARMTRGEEDRISDYFLIDNEEQITLCANRLGWRVVEIRHGECEGWFWCEMVRGE